MGSRPKAPPAPEPVDPGAATISYLFGAEPGMQGLGVASPEVMSRLAEAESLFGPQFIQNQLQRQEASLFGTDGQAGLLDLQAQTAPVLEQIRADTMSAQREADIADVEALGSRATEALRASDPERQRLMEQQRGLVDDLFGRAARVTPQQAREAEQSAREAFQARGRDLDNLSIFSEALGREEFLRRNRAEALGAAQGLFGQYQATAADPFQAVLGRGSQVPAMSMATGQQALGFSPGPQIFDPDAGVNLALANQANQANYNANVYGAQAASRGATMGGLFGGLGSALGGLFG